MNEMKPIKTLRLNRETVKRLAVRTSVRTGMVDTTTGAAGSGIKGPPKQSDSFCAIQLSYGNVPDPIVFGG